MVNIRSKKIIPALLGQRALGLTPSKWNSLVAQGVIEVEVKEDKRGSVQSTDWASLERAARKLAAS